MRTIFSVMMAVLLAGSSVWAAETERQVQAKKHAQEMAQLSKKNDQTVRALARKIEYTWNWHVAKQPKNFSEIVSNVNEIVRLVSLKEGAAPTMTVADAKLLLARAYAKPVNLRYAAETEKAYKDALAAMPADKKGTVEQELKQYLYDVGKGARPAVVATAKPAKSDQKALAAWYRERVRGVRYNEKVDLLAKENCHDGKIELCDQAIAELTDARDKKEFVLRKAQLLTEMSQWLAAQDIYMVEWWKIEDPTSKACVEWLTLLGDLNAKRAARYYAKPDATIMRQAFAYWEEALRLDPKNGGILRKMIEQSLIGEDYAAAKRWLDAYVPLIDTKRDARSLAWVAACYGDIAYFAGDYEEAVRRYGSVEKFPDAPTLVQIPNSHQRYAGALYALGRYEECEKALDACPNYWSFKDTNAYYRRLLKAKRASRQKQK